MVTSDAGPFIRYVLAKLDNAADGEAVRRTWSDIDPGSIKGAIDIWEAGLAGEVPNVLKPLYEEFQRTKNPEYQTYLRLKEKFGGK